jgi:SAM-dependent methyltransferase
MQTPAEKCLVQFLVKFLEEEEQKIHTPPRILNIGAGKSLSIENQLTGTGCNYICDRVDVVNCDAVHPAIGKCWICSAETMSPVESDHYSAAFANYVLEHISNLNLATREIYRVLKPRGIFVASASNPTAPEFVLAKWTPTWFHKTIRRSETWETHYAYKNIKELTGIFKSAGLHVVEIKYYSFVEGYLAEFPLLNVFGKFYDKVISVLKIKRFMGNVCIVFEKR